MQGAESPRRPVAPEVEWTLGFECSACHFIANEVTFTADAQGDGPTIKHPGACPACGNHVLSMSRKHRVMNLDDYSEPLTGWQMRMRLDPKAAPVWRAESREAVYRLTGERFRYERTYDHENDLYSKRYTNLETGEVAVESTEPLSQHTGRGSARRPPAEGP